MNRDCPKRTKRARDYSCLQRYQWEERDCPCPSKMGSIGCDIVVSAKAILKFGVMVNIGLLSEGDQLCALHRR
ncbi:MAG: hypothetical protein KAH38_01675 [Candidatus Hydrogenedentes bacterium]|nr:hypothetical protein [Candidatus Hydrogenedentota bacterium]